MFNVRKNPNMYSKISLSDIALVKKCKFGELPEIVILSPSHKKTYGIKTSTLYTISEDKESDKLNALDEFNTPVGTIEKQLNPFKDISASDAYSKATLSTHSMNIEKTELMRKISASSEKSNNQTTTLLDAQILQREIDNNMTAWLNDSRNFEAIKHRQSDEEIAARENYSKEFGL